MNVELSPGQTHETQRFSKIWDGTEVSDEDLKYFVQPEALAGDMAYESRVIYEQLEQEDVKAVIPKRKKRRKKKKKSKGKQVDAADETLDASDASETSRDKNPEFDRELYRRRNIVERVIGWLKESRRVFSRFEKTAVNYLAMIHIAAIRMYLAEALE